MENQAKELEQLRSEVDALASLIVSLAIEGMTLNAELADAAGYRERIEQEGGIPPDVHARATLAAVERVARQSGRSLATQPRLRDGLMRALAAAQAAFEDPGTPT